MARLVLLVVAAAWAAVLIPPLLRSRIENRPNSSVTDFRRQLNRLQTTATPRGPARAMGRPLAPSPSRGASPLHRQAAAGRPGQPLRQASLRGATATRTRPAAPSFDTPGYRTHRDSTGGASRPEQRRHRPEARPAAPRRAPAGPAVDPAVVAKRRRTNILLILAALAGSTMFLAATTSSTVMLYLFAASFLGLCGYVYLLAQIREREEAGWGGGWLDDQR